jgi:hypothetical protein
MDTTARGDDADCAPGIYLIDEAERAEILNGGMFPPDYVVAILDGVAAGSREGFFTEIARVLHFPDYFGRNWDAVNDCLTDLTWLPATGYVLLFDGFGLLAHDQPDQWRIGLNVLSDAAAFWKQTRTPMFILLYGPRDDAPGIPAFPVGCLPPRRNGTENSPS